MLLQSLEKANRQSYDIRVGKHPSVDCCGLLAALSKGITEPIGVWGEACVRVRNLEYHSLFDGVNGKTLPKHRVVSKDITREDRLRRAPEFNTLLRTTKTYSTCERTSAWA